MANEITYTLKTKYSSGGVEMELNSAQNVSIDSVGTESLKSTQQVDQTETVLEIGNCNASSGDGIFMAAIHRGGGLDPQDPGYIDIGVQVGASVHFAARLKNGEAVLLRFPPGSVPAVVSDDEEVILEYMLVEG